MGTDMLYLNNERKVSLRSGEVGFTSWAAYAPFDINTKAWKDWSKVAVSVFEDSADKNNGMVNVAEFSYYPLCKRNYPADKRASEEVFQDLGDIKDTKCE